MRELPRPSITAIWEEAGGEILGPDRGNWRRARCVFPDHSDRTASAAVNEESGKYHCHSCDKSGDALDLLMRLHGIGFPEAVARAAGLAGTSDGGVRESSQSGGLLPRRKRTVGGGGGWKPPWIRG